MKILFVSHDAKLYGAPRSLLNLIQGLQRYHPQIAMHVLLPSEGPLAEELRQLRVPFTVAKYPLNVYKRAPRFFSGKTLRNGLQSLRALSCLPGLMKIIKPLNPDIIYTNTSAVSIGFFLARLLGKKHIWHIREFGRENQRQLYSYGNNLQRRFYNLSDLIIVISKAIQQKELQGLHTKVRQIYNGVYFSDELNWQARSIAGKNTLTFGMVANILENKGQDEALNAFYELQQRRPGARLLLAGGGNEQFISRLKDTCRQWGILEKVEFTGYVKNTEACYERIDILLNCSLIEGMGRSIVEALAHGIPVIGRRSGGVPEVIKDKENGYLYDKAAELPGKMEALAGDPAQYAQFSSNAIAQVKQNFTIEQYTGQVYEELTAVAGSPDEKRRAR